MTESRNEGRRREGRGETFLPLLSPPPPAPLTPQFREGPLALPAPLPCRAGLGADLLFGNRQRKLECHNHVESQHGLSGFFYLR